MAKNVDSPSVMHGITWKAMTTIIVMVSILSGMITSVVAWLHADVLVPKILQRTAAQTERAIGVHSEHPHPPSASKAALEMTEKVIRSDVQNVEEKIDEFKTDTKERLDRIEDKLDRM